MASGGEDELQGVCCSANPHHSAGSATVGANPRDAECIRSVWSTVSTELSDVDS
jgi:hypothetical protein